MLDTMIDAHIQCFEGLKKMAPALEKAGADMLQCLLGGGKILICGNGGSASDAQHFAAEIVGRFEKERRAFPAIALSTDTSILTAVGNDYGYDRVFCRQVEALVSQGDTVIGLSTSGNSPNVVEAMKTAREKGATTIALTGRDGGRLADVADIVLKVPSTRTPRIQEAHITIGHIVCMLVERRIYPILSKGGEVDVKETLKEHPVHYR